MAYYTVYWPQDRVEELKKAGDTGPIKVIYGSIHSRMPTIVSVKTGISCHPGKKEAVCHGPPAGDAQGTRL